jgi:hypothetical protein
MQTVDEPFVLPARNRDQALSRLRKAILAAARSTGALVACAATTLQLELARQAVHLLERGLFHYRQPQHEDKPVEAIVAVLEEVHATQQRLRQFQLLGAGCTLREQPSQEARIRLACEAAQLTYNLIDLLQGAGHLECATPAARSACHAVPRGDIHGAAWALTTLAETEGV